MAVAPLAAAVPARLPIRKAVQFNMLRESIEDGDRLPQHVELDSLADGQPGGDSRSEGRYGHRIQQTAARGAEHVPILHLGSGQRDYFTFFGWKAEKGSVSGLIRTAVVNLKGYLPPLGYVISTK